MLTIKPGQHNRSNPPDSESYRSRSPPTDERGREKQILAFNMNSTGVKSRSSPQDFERRHDCINGAYLTPTSRGQLPEGEGEQAVRPRDSEVLTGDIPAVLRSANEVSQGTNTTRANVHEMPVPSRHSSGASPYKPSGRIDTRLGGFQGETRN